MKRSLDSQRRPSSQVFLKLLTLDPSKMMPGKAITYPIGVPKKWETVHHRVQKPNQVYLVITQEQIPLEKDTVKRPSDMIKWLIITVNF